MCQTKELIKMKISISAVRKTEQKPENKINPYRTKDIYQNEAKSVVPKERGAPHWQRMKIMTDWTQIAYNGHVFDGATRLTQRHEN